MAGGNTFLVRGSEYTLIMRNEICIYGTHVQMSRFKFTDLMW